MASRKVQRLSSDILRFVNQIILTEIEDAEIKKITITDCNVTSDLSYANLFYTYYGSEEESVIDKTLADAAPFIRGKLSQLIELRHTPSIRFKYDHTIEVGQKIEKIISDINKD